MSKIERLRTEFDTAVLNKVKTSLNIDNVEIKTNEEIMILIGNITLTTEKVLLEVLSSCPSLRGCDEGYIKAGLASNKWITRETKRMVDNASLIILGELSQNNKIVLDFMCKYLLGQKRYTEFTAKDIFEFVVSPLLRDSSNAYLNLYRFVDDNLVKKEEYIDIEKSIKDEIKGVLDQLYEKLVLKEDGKKVCSRKVFEDIVSSSQLFRDFNNAYVTAICNIRHGISLISANSVYSEEPNDKNVKYLKKYFGISDSDTLRRNNSRLMRKEKMLSEMVTAMTRFLSSEVSILVNNYVFEKKMKDMKNEKHSNTKGRGRKSK